MNNMNNKTIYTYLAVLPFLFSGCVSLDEDPASSQVTTKFYQNTNDAKAAVTAAYAGLLTGEDSQPMYNRGIHLMSDEGTDDYVAGPYAKNANVQAISKVAYDASNDRFEAVWRDTYSAINYANIAVDKISALGNISEELRNQYVNEAKFLRALHYFNLVRWFRNVPLILHETTSLSSDKVNVKQASADEVYAQIIKDLTDAENLPVSYSAEDAGRATSGAAKALLAKVYLTRQDWQKAADKAKEVIDSKRYALFENFDDAFDSSTKNGKEHIFSIQFNGYPASYNNMNANAPTALSYEVPGAAGIYADAYNSASDLYASFGDKDKRRDVSFATEVKVPTTGKVYKLSAPHINKFYDPNKFGNQGSSERNFTYMRYSDVLLIYAEAENELHGPTADAYAKIDEVRARAGIDLLKDIAPHLTKDEFREYVFEERRKEFVYELNRWFDLTRRGADYFVAKLHAAGKKNASAKNVILPIPQRELDLNPNLVQNDEWK